MPERNKFIFLRLTSASYGGIESQILLLAEAMAAKGKFEPVLLTSDMTSQLSESFKRNGFAVHAVLMGRLNIFGAADAIDRSIDFSTVAVIESHMFRESFYGRALKRRFPHVIHTHRAHTYIDCSWIPEWRKRAYHLADRLTSGYVDAYFVNGEYLKNELVARSGIAADKVCVILNGSAPLAPSSAPVSGSSDPLRPVVAMVANLLEHKGHDVLIKSLALLKSRGLTVKARLIGSTSSDVGHVDALKRLAQTSGVLDQLDFFGFTDDIPAALQDIPVLVLPSDSEGLPICVLEGMNLKKIVVATEVGAVSECIISGKNGFLHRPQDPAALADILQKLFTVPADSLRPMAEAAYETWRTRFSQEHMLCEFGRVYSERFGLEVY